MGMNMIPSTISEPPPAYTNARPLHHSHTAYQQLPKADTLYDPITGERIRRYGFNDRSLRANQRKIWCMFVLTLVLIMVALIIVGIAYHFGRQDASNSSTFESCVPTAANGYNCVWERNMVVFRVEGQFLGVREFGVIWIEIPWLFGIGMYLRWYMSWNCRRNRSDYGDDSDHMP